MQGVIDSKSLFSYGKNMGLIIQKLRVAGDKGERRLQVLFDTGASASFVRRDVVDRIATTVKLPSPESYTLGDGVGRLRVNKTVVLHVYIDGVRISDNFIVAPRLSDEVIIGANTLQKWRIKLDLENERVIIDKRMARLLLA
ncbi:MAG: retroviral-like aspartic protease [Deltaproteobacteria bacterium]|nr:retroviral-like aspartic protease [Deltaproteobacteria bacterium]